MKPGRRGTGGHATLGLPVRSPRCLSASLTTPCFHSDTRNYPEKLTRRLHEATLCALHQTLADPRPLPWICPLLLLLLLPARRPGSAHLRLPAHRLCPPARQLCPVSAPHGHGEEDPAPRGSCPRPTRRDAQRPEPSAGPACPAGLQIRAQGGKAAMRPSAVRPLLGTFPPCSSLLRPGTSVPPRLAGLRRSPSFLAMGGRDPAGPEHPPARPGLAETSVIYLRF